MCVLVVGCCSGFCLVILFKKTIGMLIDFARNKPDRQFVFLSPLDTSGIPKGQPDIVIKRMDPPKRDASQPFITEVLH
jgi:hypothetical protein